MRRIPKRAAVPAAVVVFAIAGTGIAHAATVDSVTLTVDGQQRVLDTRASDVAELLADQGISLDAHDVVAPAADAPIIDGLEVSVRNGKVITWTVDGTDQQLWTTAGTVGEAAATLGDRGRDAWFSVDRSERIPLEGIAVNVRMPKSVTVVADGQTRPVVSAAATVNDLLNQLGITVAPVDAVVPDLGAPLANGLTVAVQRVATAQFSKTVAVPFATEKRSDPASYKGTSKVIQAGVAGKAVEVYSRVTRDGAVVSDTLVSRTVTTAPVTQIIVVGTKPRPVSGLTGAGAGLNWAALARCESGGNPRAVSSGGYYGLYQFSLSTWRGVGGTGNPIDASPAEQTQRAQILYARSGARSWPTCGRLLFT